MSSLIPVPTRTTGMLYALNHGLLICLAGQIYAVTPRSRMNKQNPDRPDNAGDFEDGLADTPVTGEQSPSDEELILAYANDDSRAFDQLYKRYKARLYSFLMRRCNYDESVAQDLFQEIWLSLAKNRKSYVSKGRFAPFLFTIASNKLIDYYRYQGRRHTHPLEDDENHLAAPETQDPLRVNEAREQACRLADILATLPEEQREAIILRGEAGLSASEIAEIQNVSINTVKSRLRYALARLVEVREDD